MDISKDLIETMKTNGKDKVFVNEAGDWLFHSRDGYTEMSRAEILGDDESNESDAPKASKKKNKA